MIKFLLLFFLGASPFLLLIAFGFFVIYQDRKREKLEQEKKLKELQSY